MQLQSGGVAPTQIPLRDSWTVLEEQPSEPWQETVEPTVAMEMMIVIEPFQLTIKEVATDSPEDKQLKQRGGTEDI